MLTKEQLEQFQEWVDDAVEACPCECDNLCQGCQTLIGMIAALRASLPEERDGRCWCDGDMPPLRPTEDEPIVWCRHSKRGQVTVHTADYCQYCGAEVKRGQRIARRHAAVGQVERADARGKALEWLRRDGLHVSSSLSGYHSLFEEGRCQDAYSYYANLAAAIGCDPEDLMPDVPEVKE